MSHIACLCVGHTGELCRMAELIEMPLDLCGHKKYCFRWGPDARGWGSFERDVSAHWNVPVA